MHRRQELGLNDSDSLEFERLLARVLSITRADEQGVRCVRTAAGTSLVTIIVAPNDGRRPSVSEQIEACLVVFSRDPEFSSASCERPMILARCEENGVQLGAFSVPKVELTRSERAVAELVGQSLGNDGIARVLRKRPKTVANQLTSIFRKTNVQTRAELSKFAFLALSECEI